MEGENLRFRGPHGALTEELRSEIIKNKSKLVQTLQSVQKEATDIPPILPQDRSTPPPLSFAQQRLWFFHQLEPTSPAYNTHIALHLKGPLNVKILQESFQALVERHEPMRTSFPLVEDQPIQAIAESLPLPWREENLQEIPAPKRDQVAHELVKIEGEKPFNLKTGPVFRILLVKLTTEEFVLTITMHHICTDGWSRGILSRDLAELYEAKLKHQSANLPCLPIQYADFSIWQRKWLEGPELKRQLGYWQNQLANLEPLTLPTDFPRPTVQTFHGAIQEFQISPTILAALKKLSQRLEVTLAITLLAAFNILLGKFSGQTDIVVGSPIANRNRQEIEELIGFFVNSLIMRNDLTGNPTFADFVKRVQKVSLEAYDHQDLPFERLVEELKPPRDPSRHPFFQVTFALQNTPNTEFSFFGIRVEPFARNTTIRFDLESHIWEGKEGLTVCFAYNKALFHSRTVENLGHNFQKILDQVGRFPEKLLSDISLLNETEGQQLTRKRDQETKITTHPLCIPQLFEDQVAKSPEALAIIFGDDQVTYECLNQKANQLAYYLIEQGIGPEIPVGLCMDRSVDMIVGLLAIFKSGGIYVPLDPTYPDEQLKFRVKNSQAKIVITKKGFTQSLATLGTTLVALDTQDKDWLQFPKTNPGTALTGSNSAYVIFTSGSTGTPKGVLVAHHALANHCQVVRTEYDLQPKDRVLQFASLAFDASLEQILPSLITGTTIVLWDPEVGMPQELCQTLAQIRVTVVNFPTAYWHFLSQYSQDFTLISEKPTLRLCIVGGEPMMPSILTTWQERTFQKIRFLNAYGPTETTITATLFDIPSHFAQTPGPPGVPIGKPMPSRWCYVVDRYYHPLPQGMVGELFIGGSGVAEGYVHAPGTTAEKFLPDPFSPTPGGRLYRTGDMARYDSAGNIHFFGRRDNQIKLRGFRIELGEIEVTLRQHTLVQNAVVICREDTPGTQEMVAYIVSDHESLQASDLRTFLRERLQEYMIPGAFVILKALPLTPNGKIDKRRLPAPQSLDRTTDVPFVAPQTDLEQQIARVWKELMKLEQIGIHDNFFQLGGHSLLATQVVARVQSLSQTPIHLKEFLEHPTIAGLADVCSQTPLEPRSELLPSLTPISRSSRLAPSFSQQRLWLLDQLEPNSTAYSMPLAYHLQGPLEVPALEKSLNVLVGRHEALRSRFVMHEGRPWLDIFPELFIPLPVMDLHPLSKKEQARVCQEIIKETRDYHFDLGKGPLLRATLHRIAPDHHLFTLTLHHIVSDGWSVQILFRELDLLYQAFMKRQSPTLPPLTIHYADYAAWQRDCLQGPALQPLLDYWTTTLANIPSFLSLPTDRPRPPVQTYRGARFNRMLCPTVRQHLNDVSQAEGCTFFMTLLAVFQILLARHSGQDDIVVGTPIANRPRIELEGIIGLFLNTLVIRTNLSGAPTFRTLLHRVKESCLGAFAHQELPFERLVEALQPVRDLSRSPLFQVFFNLVDMSDTHLRLQGVTSTPALSQDETTTKFDLTLYVFLTDESIRLAWNFNTDLFNHSTIVELADQFEFLLTQVLDPKHSGLSRGIDAFQLQTILSRQILPDPTVPLNPVWHGAIPTQFQKHARQNPNHPAVIDTQGEFSYQELEQWSNKFAHYLLTQGIQSEDVVAVYAHRDTTLVLSLLGILKAGGAFVILDPAYPDARLQQILHLAKPKGLLSLEQAGPLPAGLQHVADTLSFYCSVPSLPQLKKKGPAWLATHPTTPPPVRIEPEANAYLMFTSGSAGTPKGIIGTHQPVSHFLAWYTETFGFSPEDHFTLFSGLSHDPVIRDIFTPLWSGATICIPGQEILTSTNLSLWIRNQNITVTHLTPAYLEMLASTSEPTPPSCPTLRHGVFGGDHFLPKHVKLFRQLAPHASCINGYGTTETPQLMSYWVIPSNNEDLGEVCSIGKGIEGVQLLILTPANQIAGLREVGEIYIRTPYLAKGYLQDESLTKARFQTNVFTQNDKDRWFRTGDLGRYRLDGSLEILGRLDQQVKVRGYRIELGEIEALLQLHPQIRQAVVLLQKNNVDDHHLIAFVVSQEEMDEGQLSAYLQGHLPTYMIPAKFISLDQLPLTPNGKIDHNALLALENSTESLTNTYVGPSNLLEENLVDIWQEVLKVKPIGIHNNFFTLGGHSLLAIQIVSRIHDQMQMKVTLQNLFDAPTIHQLAETLSRQRELGAL